MEGENTLLFILTICHFPFLELINEILSIIIKEEMRENEMVTINFFVSHLVI